MTTILQISPDASAHHLIQETLGKKYHVIAVYDGPTAVQYCAMLQPDLILIDVDLPQADVSELTLRLKMFMPQTPIVIFGDPADRPNSASIESDGFLSKPLDPPTLINTVEKLSPKQIFAPSVALSAGSATVEQFESQIAALNRANQRLASLNTVSALIGTSLDLEHLMDEILHQIEKTVNFDSATLFLLKGEMLEAVASRGLLEYRQGLNTYRKSDRNSAWLVVKNKLPLIINDVTDSDFWESRPELSQVRAWLGVPLIYKDRVVGVLTLDKNEPDAFTDTDARYVFTLAFQTAIAVENAQLFKAWESQAIRLRLINEINQHITAVLDIPMLYRTLAQEIAQRLQYDRVAIFEIDADRETLRLQACCYFPQSTAEPAELRGYRPNIRAGVIGAALEKKRPVLANEMSADEPTIPGLEVRASAAVPIFVDDQIVALISVDSQTPDRFDDQDLWTLGSLGTHAAAVIKNARLYHDIGTYSDRLEKTVIARTQRLEAFKKISHVISQGLSIDELLTFVGEGICQIFASDQAPTDNIKVEIGLVSGPRLVVKTINEGCHDRAGGQPEAANKSVEQSHELSYSSIAGKVIGQAQATILTDVDVQAIYLEHKVQPPASAANTIIVAPLITAGKTIGAIVVEQNRSDAFDEDDLETLESVAFQVASAIEYTRLLRKTRELAIVNERTRLAREMHDGIAQNLAYLLIQVDRGLNMVEAGTNVEKQLELLGTLLEQNIEELRRNIFDLRPVALEETSLFEALEKFVLEFGQRWNLHTSCTVLGEAERVPPAVESSLYRILQEALSNARQHACCARVSVELAVEDERRIALRIEDDGHGFDLDILTDMSPKRGNGLGLISMRERAESVGGALTIESWPGRGTKILAELPLLRARPM